MRYFKSAAISAVIATLALSGAAVAAMQPTDFGPTPEMSAQGAYVGLDLGGANVKYKYIFGGSASDWSFGNWTMAFGGNLGYQFNTYAAVELGGAYLLASKQKGSAEIQPWYLDGALKIMIPLYRDFNLFAKAGVNYISQSQGKTSISNWGPFFAVGSSYFFSNNWQGNLTFSRIAGDMKVHIPSINVLTVGAAYKFAL